MCAQENKQLLKFGEPLKSAKLTVSLLVETNNGLDFKDNESTIVSGMVFFFRIVVSRNRDYVFTENILLLLLLVKYDSPNRR